MSTHEDFGRKVEHKGPSDRSFAISFSGLFTLFAMAPLIRRGPVRLWALGVALALLIIGWLGPHLLSRVNRAWMRFGLFLSRVMTPIVMALLFYLVFTPMALIMRLFSANLLRRKLDRTASSYWIEREPPGPAPESMSVQF